MSKSPFLFHLIRFSFFVMIAAPVVEGTPFVESAAIVSISRAVAMRGCGGRPAVLLHAPLRPPLLRNG